jgi:glycosyltransferase involved in cell wall biosynthesis
MHILFLTDNFPPEVNAPATRTFEHCREWVKAGHEVTVITCAPNFPSGRVFAGYTNRLWSREQMEGINVLRVWTYITANEGFLRRTVDYASFFLTAVPASLFVRKVDLIVATSPQLFAPCAAFAAGLLKWRRYIFELRDLWPESIRAVGAMDSSILLNALEGLELFLYRRAAAVISVTNAFSNNLIARGIARDKIHVVMNGADLSRFRPLPRNEALARRLGLEGKFVAGYVGTHGMAHNLTTLLEAARLIENAPDCDAIRFLFLGDGAEKATLMARAAELGLQTVVFVDSVPRQEVPDYWSLVDVSVIHLKRTPLFETVIPSKLFECMAMGIPVLHGVAGESAEIVTREGAGLCFEPENPTELAALISRLYRSPAECATIARSALAASSKYDRKAQAERMLETLVAIEAGSRRHTPASVRVQPPVR